MRADEGRVFGYEALLRCCEPALLDPRALVHLAERLEHTRELGRWIRTSITRTKAVVGRGCLFFVNVDAADLTDEALYRADAPLARFASEVVLEVTERTALEEVPDLRERARALHEQGYRLAVDDLGAGYAGLGALATIEPDFAKLDRRLVSGIDRVPQKRKVVTSLTNLGKELGFQVIAEGIETPEEREALTQLGCALLQGFLFGTPAGMGPTGGPE